MALSTTPADARPDSPDVNGLSLQILSPSFEATGRISFRDVPTHTTVSDLKGMIAAALVTRPPPESQRLIYRGKELSDNQEKLTKILELGNGEIHSIHLVLPPGTLLQRTFASEPSLKSHQEQHNVTRPSTQQPESLRPQRIGDLLNPAPAQFGLGHESREDLSSRQDIGASHLRSSASHLLSETIHTTTQTYGGAHAGVDMSNHGDTLFNSTNNGGPSRSRENDPLVQNSSRAVASDSPMLDSSLPHTGLQGLHVNYRPGNLSRSSIDVSNTNRFHTNRSSAHRTTSNPVYSITRITSPGFATGEIQMETTRLTIISQRIIAMEEQIHHGIAPTVDEIAGIRFQLYQMVDEQYRNPLKPREPALDGWIARISSLAIRADQLRVIKARQQQPDSQQQTSLEFLNKSPAPSNSTYLLKAPNGNRYLMMRPQEQPTSATIRLRTSRQTPHIPGLLGTNAATAVAPGLVTGLPANRVFRQPLVRRRYRRYVRLIDLGAIFRSVWLFVRLYFFSYLFSAQGSWLRTILVMVSAVVAVFSETEFPGRARRLIVSPVQRHLENLLPFDDQRRQEGRNSQAPNGVNMANINPGNGPITGFQGQPPTVQAEQGGIWEGLRSLERSVAIFIASFVPGLSERHIAARNAAEAARQNAEQERQQEEDRRREEAADSTQPQAPSGGTDAPITETGSSTPGIEANGDTNSNGIQPSQQPNQEPGEQ